jgi:hypothetical protein
MPCIASGILAGAMYSKNVMPGPEIIFRMAGDMGCGDVGCCAPTRYGTPS